MVVVSMSKVMVAMICCGSKDVYQMGGAIVVCWGGEDKERVRLRGSVWVCRRLQVETHFLTSEVSVILKSTCGVA